MTPLEPREADGVRVWMEGPVARVAMARPEKRNAQSMRMLYALNAAFDAAMADDKIRVVVLSGDGPHFSAGPDLSDLPAGRPRRPQGGLGAGHHAAWRLRRARRGGLAGGRGGDLPGAPPPLARPA